MILIIDNQDSFVWNLADYVSRFTEMRVVSNSIAWKEVKRSSPDGIVISPGPGVPSDPEYKQRIEPILREFSGPILGVCLGHQIIASVFGGSFKRVTPVHGKVSPIRHDAKGLFRGIPNPISGGRYHSLAVSRIPPDFEVTAISDDDHLIMGIRHRTKPIFGLQFHPESVLTGYSSGTGLKIIENFVRVVEEQ